MSIARRIPPRRSRVLLAAFGLALWLGQGSAIAADPTFTAHLVDRSTVRGRVTSIDEKGTLTLDIPESPSRTLAATEVVRLTRDGVTPSFRPEASILLFPDGDRIVRASVGSTGETSVEIQAYSIPGKLAIPTESLLGIVFTLPTDPESAQQLIGRVREEPRQSEILWLANEDRISVGLLGLTEKAVKYQVGNREESIDRSRVVGLGFDPSLVAYPRPDGTFHELTLSDGTRLGVGSGRIEAGHFVGTARFGLSLRIPLTEIARIHLRSPAVVYLTERKPAAEKVVPYVGPGRPSRRDATVEGGPFRLRGEEFDRGVGTESRTLLAYRLEPGDRKFQATVGVDDRAGPLGNVKFKVLVDGRERFASPALSAGDDPQVIDVDIQGAKLLILSTEFGERGGVRDLADWVEARIIR